MTYKTLCQNGPECFFLQRGVCWFHHPTPSAKSLAKANVNSNYILPPEILEKIFSLLPPLDLKTVMLVCKFWKQAGEVPWLWSWACFCLNGESLSSWAWIHVQDLSPLTVWENIINSRRIKLVKRLSVKQVNKRQVEAILDIIAGDSFLQSLSITSSWSCLVPSDIHETPIKPQLLVRAINKLEEFIADCRLSDKQVQAIFEDINGDSELKKLQLKNCNLALVKPKALAIAVNKMYEVNLENYFAYPFHKMDFYPPYAGHMTKDQAEAILTQSLLETSLKILSFGFLYDNRSVDRKLFKQARKIIGELQFNYTYNISDGYEFYA